MLILLATSKLFKVSFDKLLEFNDQLIIIHSKTLTGVFFRKKHKKNTNS
jgi:hypothetical protein